MRDGALSFLLFNMFEMFAYSLPNCFEGWREDGQPRAAAATVKLWSSRSLEARHQARHPSLAETDAKLKLYRGSAGALQGRSSMGI